MASQTILPRYESQRQSDVEYSKAADVYGRTIIPKYVDSNLCRQIERWVNEGGAAGDGLALPVKARNEA